MFKNITNPSTWTWDAYGCGHPSPRPIPFSLQQTSLPLCRTPTATARVTGNVRCCSQPLLPTVMLLNWFRNLTTFFKHFTLYVTYTCNWDISRSTLYFGHIAEVASYFCLLMIIRRPGVVDHDLNSNSANLYTFDLNSIVLNQTYWGPVPLHYERRWICKKFPNILKCGHMYLLSFSYIQLHVFGNLFLIRNYLWNHNINLFLIPWWKNK